MPCTKEQLVTAINSYASARTTGDGPLIQMAAASLSQVVDTLEFTELGEEQEDVD